LFDISIGPLVNLWVIGSDNPYLPTESERAAAMSHIDWHNVILFPDERSVFLKNAGMSIDLGAIAKGWAADEVARLLRKGGVHSAIINLGGNVYTLGTKANGKLWKIGVQDPNGNRGSYIGYVTIGESALITSGIYERYFIEDGVRYHHLLDPRTGQPARTGVAGVTVLAPTSTAGDALSTSLFVMGVEKGMELVGTLPDVEAMYVLEDKTLVATKGFLDKFTQTNFDYSLAEGSE